MSKIKTFEAACKQLDLKPENVIPKPVEGLNEVDNKSLIAYAKLMVIARAINDNWTPDWDDYSQYKYYPWFKMSPSVFVCDRCAYFFGGSYAGSRLCFKSAELAKYAGTQFVDLYKEYMLF